MKTRKIKERNDSSWRRKKIANSPPQNPSSMILSQGENGQIRENIFSKSILPIYQHEITIGTLGTWFPHHQRNLNAKTSRKNISIDIFYSVWIVLIFVQQQSIVEGACGTLASNAIYKRLLLPELCDSSINGSSGMLQF